MAGLALEQFDQSFCSQFKVLPIFIEDTKVNVLSCDESDLSILDYIRFHSKSTIQLTRLSNTKFQDSFNTRFGVSNGVAGGAEPGPTAEAEHISGEITRQIDKLILSCVARNASDIHFEPQDGYVICRERIDGSLREIMKFPSNQKAALLSRLKIMSSLDIAEKRRPQDGRIRFESHGRLVDIRVSIIPTDFGEKAVLRILDKSSLRLDLTTLGFTESQLAMFTEKIKSPHGIILVTGPTGSGKTTTLYSALNEIRSSSVNISTIEDPIEYNLEGINQTQVHPDINLTFAAMLRAILRQDPDVIMIGEIRDRETLDMAIRASLTGHLVLSTLHTNSAVATLSRLLDMGAEPYLLSSALRLIVAQRLIKVNCRHCVTNELDYVNVKAMTRLKITSSDGVLRGVGCQECDMTGYDGRTAIIETLPITDDIRVALADGLSEQEISQLAQVDGDKTIEQQGIELIHSGTTTPVEVIRQINL